ncbi:hypothetical protein [uncultured Alsobacter sp.]|uniref:hypothetical protein n=1 Tax=uncultured Alsobacter sp. TaxID=1748258 RepID=UPI0025ECD2CC|nr:hypothetical protein [uncultured Alsobacter sp.]
MTGGKDSDLHKAAEKALRMKKDAGPEASTPPHRSAKQGGVRGPQVGMTDTAVGREPTQTPNLKRSHNPRTGDA